MHFSTDWLTDLPMSTDEHNSRMARARDLVSLIQVRTYKILIKHKKKGEV